MNLLKQNDHKQMGFKRFLLSFKYSFAGLAYAYKNEQSLFLHAVGSLFAIIFGIILHISFAEWAIILISLVVVLAVELLNTAIEATVDLITKDIHPLAKIAKDCASAAAFVSGIAAVIICLFIFIPKFMIIFS